MKPLEDSIARHYLMPWLITALTLLAILLVLIDVASAQVGSAGGAPPTVAAETAKPAPPAPRLSPSDIESLAELVQISNAAAKELQTAQLYLEAAQRKSESIGYYGQAKRLRILAKMSLDPDLWDVQLVTVGPENAQRQEWQIVPIKPKDTPAAVKEKPTP